MLEHSQQIKKPPTYYGVQRVPASVTEEEYNHLQNFLSLKTSKASPKLTPEDKHQIPADLITLEPVTGQPEKDSECNSRGSIEI